MSANNVLNSIDYSNEQFQGLKLAADWIRDLESSDSRIHKEKVIEKALMAAKLGSANAQCFLFNCYQAYNPFFVSCLHQQELHHRSFNLPLIVLVVLHQYQQP